MMQRMLAALAGLAAWVAAPSPASAQNAVAIKGGKVVTMKGDAIPNGVVLIRDGKIVDVGKDVNIPTEARVIDATGKVVMPGFIDVHSPRGVEQSTERNTNTPFLSVIDSLDPSMEYFEECRRNGVTAIAAVPGEDTMIGSQAAVVKTAGTYIDQMVLKRRFAVKISLKPTPDRSRMSQLAALRKEFDAAKTFMEDEAERKAEAAKKKDGGKKEGAPKEGEKKDEKKEEKKEDKSEKKEEKKDAPKSDATNASPPASPVATPQIEALVKVLKGELKVYIYCENAMDVPQALKLIRQYNLKAILCLGPNTYKAARTAVLSGLPIVLDSQLVFWETDPRTGEDKQIAVPKIYYDLDATFAFQTTGFQGGSLFRQANLPPTVGTNYLWFQAATAVKYGMPEQKALEAMTTVPAKWLGVESFVGTLEPGKDGDVVILSGDPLKLATWVDATLVNGSVVYERSKDKRLEQLLQPKKG
jgi:imidazolonepropionase-like amidohydrolase